LTAADKRPIERAAARARRTVSDWVRLSPVDAARAELENAKTKGSTGRDRPLWGVRL